MTTHMSSGHSSKTRVLSYPDAIGFFQDDAVIAELKESFKAVAQSMLNLMNTFETISSSLQSPAQAAMKSRWNAIHQDFNELVWQSRTSAGLISGRLRIFCTVVLPLVVRDSRGESTRLQLEKLQVLQSYINITSDHSRLTWGLVENHLKLMSSMNSFHTEFSRYASSKSSNGQQELQELCQKLVELESNVKQLYVMNSRLLDADITYVAYSALRVVAFSGRRRSQLKVAHHHLSLTGQNLSNVEKQYEELDRTRNEIAHKHYAAQIAHRKDDSVSVTRATLSSLVSDTVLTLEGTLSFFLGTWSQLQTDCFGILKCIREPSTVGMPPCAVTYSETGLTIYSAIGEALECYVATLDQSDLSLSDKLRTDTDN